MLTTLALLLFYLGFTFLFGTILRLRKVSGLTGDFKNESFILLPFMGVSILISVIQSFGLFYGSKFIIPILFVVSIILLIHFLFSLKGINVSLNKEIYGVTFLFLVIFLVYGLPSIVSGFPTSFSSINNDLIFYLSIPEWLINMSYFAPSVSDGLHPFYSIAEIHFSRYSRVGADYLNTIGMNLFGIGAVQTFNVISCFFVILLSVAIYYTCRHCFNLTKPVTYTATVLVTLNTFLYWMFTTQYMPQIGGNAFFVLSFGLLYKIFIDENTKMVPYVCLSISALFAIYSEYTAYLIVPFSLFVVLLVLKNRQSFKSYSKLILYLVAGIVVLNPVSIYLAVRYNLFAFTSTQNATGIVDYIPFWNQVLMIFGVKTLDYGSPSLILSTIAGILLLITFIGLIKVEKPIRTYLAIFVGFIMALLIYLTFINKFSYGYYKTLMFAQPFIILLFSIGLYKLASVFSRFRKVIAISVILCLCLANAAQIYKLGNVIVKEGELVTNEYLELEAMKKLIPEDEIVLLDGFNMNDQHLLSYFLRDRKILFQEPGSYFAPFHLADFKPNYVLTNKKNDIIKRNGETLWNNSEFTLYKDAKLFLFEGWHGMEDWNGVPTRWTTSNFSLSLGEHTQGNFVLQFMAHLPPSVQQRTLEIYVDDKKIDELLITQSSVYFTKPISFTDNRKISFEIKEGYVKVGEDPRELGIAIQDLNLIRQ